MPLYDYTCTKEACGITFEETRPYENREEQATCPECGSPAKYMFSFNGVARVTFERNGKKGVEIRTSGGGKRIVSATREKYEHDVGNRNSKDLKGFRPESVYSKGVQKVVDQKKLAEEKKK